MEKYRNLTACSMEFLDDPVLKTTAVNYDFKYVPGEQFQRVIRTVHRDRLKQKKDSIWSEFCSTKMRPTIVNAIPNVAPSKYEMKPHQKSRDIVRTKASTIKIISQPMVESKIEVQKSVSPRESYGTYKVPKVRIMTDEEIKNVVESAFKEVIEQSGNSQVVSQFQTSHEDRKNVEIYPTDVIIEKTKNDSPELGPDGDKCQLTVRSMKSNRSVSTIRSVSEEQTVPDATPFKPTEDLEICSFESSNDSAKVSARSQLSIRSNLSYKCDDQTDNHCLKEGIVNPNSEDHAVEDIEEKTEVENKLAKTPKINIIPGLTCIEKEEFRKFLGVEEFILDSEIDLNRFDKHPSSSSEDDDVQMIGERNIQPLIHIRQPTPRYATEPLIRNLLGPIQSSSSIAEPVPENVESPKSNAQKKPTPRKAPTPRRKDISPSKLLTKPTGLSSSQASLLSAKKAKTPRSATKKKMLRSSGSSFELLRNEIKQENDILLSKIITFLVKIIEAFEKIRADLDDIPELDGPLDIKRREKRADEFIGRFSRNYLYQIGRSIEDIRIISKEQYLAGRDSDLPTKACSLFSTLSQSVQSYLKHMSSFIVDQNPKKLGTLADAVSEATKMCVHKKLFEKSDGIVQDILRKTKSLNAFLTEAQQNVPAKTLTNQKQKSKTVKIVKNGQKVSKQPKKLSMYDCLPVSTSGVKNKMHPLKGTARSKTSVRSLATRPSCESAVVNKKNPKKVAEKTSTTRMQSKETIKQQVKPPIKVVRKTCKDDEFPIKTPRMDHVTTLVEAVQNDDFQDELTLETSEHFLNSIIANMNDEPIKDSTQLENDTVIQALESLTKQQVQQILGPIVSNLEEVVTTKAGGAGVDVHTILNLIASHLGGGGGGGGVGSAGPSAGNEETFKQQNQEGNDFNSERYDTGSLSNAGHAYDNNANYERELAVQNQPRLDEPHPPAAPAPNTFPAGELNSNLVTSSQLPTSTSAMSQDPNGEGIQDNGTLDFGARTMTRAPDSVEGNAASHNGGSDLGATKSEVETQKVQRVRCDRNVQFTFVTDTEEDEIVRNFGHQTNKYMLNFTGKEQQLSDQDVDKCRIAKLLEDRFHFKRQIANSPLYVNENFGQPWRIVSKIANQIVDEAINDVEQSINFGEETFVRDFIQMELQS